VDEFEEEEEEGNVVPASSPPGTTDAAGVTDSLVRKGADTDISNLQMFSVPVSTALRTNRSINKIVLAKCPHSGYEFYGSVYKGSVPVYSQITFPLSVRDLRSVICAMTGNTSSTVPRGLLNPARLLIDALLIGGGVISDPNLDPRCRLSPVLEEVENC